MTPRPRRVAAIVLVLLGWTMMAALFTPQHWVLTRRAPNPPHWSQLFLGNLIMFWAWAALTPAILWIGRRLPIEGPRLALHLVSHFLGGFAFTLTHIAIVRYANAVLAGQPPQPWTNYLVGYGATGVLVAWGIMAAGQALIYFRRYQDRELRLVQAELKSLKTQLHPHFLFNTLNAIAELLHQDTARAERTITQLSDLLRHALTRGSAQEIPLKDELDFLRSYVHIQQTLLQERLTVRWNVGDDALDACVPAMLLQPLVENAVQHGIAPRARGGSIDITARREGDRLFMEIADDGAGLQMTATADGIGLANTRARLRHMYGSRHTFEIAARTQGGVTVQLSVPFRQEGAR